MKNRNYMKNKKDGQKSFIVCLFIFVLLVLNIGIVNAEFSADATSKYHIEQLANTNEPSFSSVTVSGSIMTIKTTGSVSGYYIGQKNSINDASTRFIKTTSNTYYASVRNGTYYVWVVGGSTASGSMRAKAYGAVNVTSSCSDQAFSNATGSGTFEWCYVYQNGTVKPENSSVQAGSCASGYHFDQANTKIIQNNCNGAKTSYNGQPLDRVYCKVIYSYSCVKDGGSGGGNTEQPVAAATITSLTVSNASLSPAFNPSTKNYTANVGADVSSVTINANSNYSFVSGYGPRTVSLNYGSNKYQIKVKNSANKVTTYTININRADGRSSVNTLSSLTLSVGNLSPAFNSANTLYTATVPNDTTTIRIGATPTDGNATFLEGFGPREITVNEGITNALIKVQSQNGLTKVYTINIIKESSGGAACNTEIERFALLKEIEFKTDIEGVELEELDFDPNTLSYNIKVPYQVGNLTVVAYVQDDGDTYTITGGDNLEVNIEQDIEITVTSKSCSNITKVYHVGVTRQPEVEESSNAELKSITIKNHDEFTFAPNNDNYNITLHKNERQLEILYEKEHEGATCNVEGNKNLKYGSKVTLTCTSEDETRTVKYTFNIAGVEKGTNVFLIALIILIVILIVVYLILRLLGYKIYFNFAVIGAFFRSIGEKIRNIFDK